MDQEDKNMLRGLLLTFCPIVGAIFAIAGFLMITGPMMNYGGDTTAKGWVALIIGAVLWFIGSPTVRRNEHQQIKEGLRDRQNNPAKYRERDRQAEAERRRAHNDDD